jgi:hypothetical protein
MIPAKVQHITMLIIIIYIGINSIKQALEHLNSNQKNFNINEIPIEFHKYLKLSSTTKTPTSNSRDYRSLLRIRLRNNNDIPTVLDDIKFKPPPVPPPPIKLPIASNDKIFKITSSTYEPSRRSVMLNIDNNYELEHISDNESSSDWSDNKINIDQIEAAPVPAPNRQSRNSRHDQFHLRQLRFLHRTPHASTTTTPTPTQTTATKTNEFQTVKKSMKYKLNLTKKISIKIPFVPYNQCWIIIKHGLKLYLFAF